LPHETGEKRKIQSVDLQSGMFNEPPVGYLFMIGPRAPDLKRLADVTRKTTMFTPVEP